MKYTITKMDTDPDGYSIATLTPGGGIITDNPYWDSPDGSGHYVPDVSDKNVGDSIVV